jgi:hypothetical protein
MTPTALEIPDNCLSGSITGESSAKQNLGQQPSNGIVSRIQKDFASWVNPIAESRSGCSNFLLVVIPQVQLSPFVYALLLEEKFLLTRDIILIHNRSQALSFELFRSFPNIIQLDVALSRNVEDEYLCALNEVLRSSSITVSSLVLHNFAGGINERIAQMLHEGNLSKKDNNVYSEGIEVIYYADGSRNNPFPETSQEGYGFYTHCFSSNQRKRMAYFGFRHHTAPEDEADIIVSYDYVLSGLRTLSRRTSINGQSFDNNVSYALILTRYWGRHPYFFDETDGESVSQLFAFASTKHLAKSHMLLLRDDNRFSSSIDDIMTAIRQQDFNCALFSDMFQVANNGARSLLLECFLLENPEVLPLIKQFYSFDSSFPLVFQNRDLYSSLSHDAELIVGFPRDAVSSRGSGECYSVMKKRTIETVYSIYQCGLFNIFCDGLLIVSPYLESNDPLGAICTSFDGGDGYFILKKP